MVGMMVGPSPVHEFMAGASDNERRILQPEPAVLSRDISRRKAGRPKGRRAESADLTQVDRYIGADSGSREYLIEYLHCIQDDLGHLPAHLLVALAERLCMAPTEVL